MVFLPAKDTSTTNSHSRFRLFVLTALVWAAFFPATAQADLVYTWNSGGGESATGTLDVQSSAETNGQITFADVISFAWSDPFASYTAANLDSASFPIKISTTSGAFTSTTTLTFLSSTLVVPIGPGQGVWHDDSGHAFGLGSWTVATDVSAAPEPSTLASAAIGLATIAGFAARRRKRATA